MKIVPLVATLIFLSACTEKDTQETSSYPNEFEIFCDKFTDLVQDEGYSDLTPEERSQLLDQSFSKVVNTSSDAYLAWSAIKNATPSQRAELYSDAAKSVGNTEWECPAIKEFADQVGAN
ncbi:hypothetical protein [uncultured Microbulbifer sp.]|uniref:hypothetical protein n=1 Tax=uncultured Microbulbifer sp. TaxID=348147 RepID=UPI0026376CAE|nr:hypothetical protein [uncultured Microbulbifer sp.]